MKYFSLLSLLLTSYTLFCQNPPCGTDDAVRKSLEENPEIQITIDELSRFTENFTPNREATYIIPVVVHVIHNNGAGNLTLEQVESAIDIINIDFQKMNEDTSDVIDEFQSIIGDMKIEFRLAKLDPDGNCTTGLTKTVSEMTYNAGENVKSLVSWNTYKYLNIWVVNNIESGAGAYAYYPGTAPGQDNEGIVCRNSQFGGAGVSGNSNFSRRTLTHEIGHYLNLPHTWGNSNDVALPENCWYDDGVSDTPETIGTSQSCNLNQSTCGSLDNIQNYMDYSTCSKMFTNGQVNRAHAALNSFAGGRYYLWQESNLWATGTHDDYNASPCEPIADFYASFDQVCEGDYVDFFNVSYNGTTNDTWTYFWEFEDGVPATSTEEAPEVSFSSPGFKNITLTATHSGGSGTTVKTSFIEVKSITGGEIYPFQESFEFTDFPEHESEELKNWTISSTDNITWDRNTNASVDGNASMAVRLRVTDEESIHELISPPIDFSDESSSVYMTFHYAYAKRNDDSNDNLKVQISTNCGKSWLTRMSLTGSDLSTNGDVNISSSNFIPDNDEWFEKTVNLGPVIGKQGVLIRFLVTSQKGNYLYIDNLNIGEIDNSIKEELFFSSIEILPTYGNEFPMLTINGEFSSEFELSVFDVLGKTYLNTRITQQNQIDLNTLVSSEVANGIYYIQVKTVYGQRTFKFIKGK